MSGSSFCSSCGSGSFSSQSPPTVFTGTVMRVAGMLLLDTVSLRPSALEIPPYGPKVLMPVEVVSSQPTPPKSVLNSLI